VSSQAFSRGSNPKANTRKHNAEYAKRKCWQITAGHIKKISAEKRANQTTDAHTGEQEASHCSEMLTCEYVSRPGYESGRKKACTVAKTDGV
jgi:hypothetical protein